jgi:hypothetical protein
MRMDLLDLVFRLETRFGVRIIRAVARSPRLYDSAFDPCVVVKKTSRTHALQVQAFGWPLDLGVRPLRGFVGGFSWPNRTSS